MKYTTYIDFGFSDLGFLDFGQDGWLKSIHQAEDREEEEEEKNSWTFEKTSLHLWWLLTRQAAMAWDVGSFNGLYAMVAAKGSLCQVLAFEPMTISYGTLVLNLRLNELEGKVTAINAALGPRNESSVIFSSAGPYVMTSGESLLNSDRLHSYLIASVSPDSMLSDQTSRSSIQGWSPKVFATSPSVIKLDVEGYESEVIRGAWQLIFGEQRYPDIIVELLDEKTQREFANEVPTNYRFYSVTETTGTINAPPVGSSYHWDGPANYWATCRNDIEVNAIAAHLQKSDTAWRVHD